MPDGPGSFEPVEVRRGKHLRNQPHVYVPDERGV
jgi:hypothetical protein